MHGAEIDNNPAPGNKEGGLTTIYEKSLGAVMKSGSTPMVYSLHHGVAQPAPTAGARAKRAFYDALFGRRTLRRVQAIVLAYQTGLAGPPPSSPAPGGP